MRDVYVNVEYVLELAQTGLTEMRALIFELRPESPKREGLIAATGTYPGHLGLKSMRERTERLGGTFEITSTPNGGTRITGSIAS